MTRWNMIHKIKALYDNGQGQSQRSIAQELGISRTTVGKYLKMSEEEIQNRLEHPERARELDQYRETLKQLLGRYPKLKTPKVRRKLNQHHVTVTVSDRTLSRYIREIKAELPKRLGRVYEPVTDLVPGEQCQVDLGEQRGVKVGGVLATLYFAVFVLSFSRRLFAALSPKPINTEDFIQMHDEAFRHFGGMVEHCVYDQTKLVVLREEFREVWFNERFCQYAGTVGFAARVCEGYDPESKGKVEAGVKYVKEDFLYGEEFESWTDARERLKTWLVETADQRIHGTTGRRPRELFESQERVHLRPYLRPSWLKAGDEESELRRVDRVQLVSFRGVRYSVPAEYRDGQVRVQEREARVFILDPESREVVAEHPLSRTHGDIVKNSTHYRDHSRTLAEREQQVQVLVGEELGRALCEKIKVTHSGVYKDQLAGLLKVVSPYVGREGITQALQALAERSRLSATAVREYLETIFGQWKGSARITPADDQTSNARTSLAAYQALAGGRL